MIESSFFSQENSPHPATAPHPQPSPADTPGESAPTHGLPTASPFARHSSPAQAINVRDPQAMKAKVRLFDFNEELLPSPRRLEWKLHRELLSSIPEPLQSGVRP